MILVIDNYDSFTWNLVQRIGELRPSIRLGEDVLVVRNDRISVDEAQAMRGGKGPERVIISPGPCTPAEAGVSRAFVEHFAGRVPMLGVCLGHQCIGAVNRMTVAQHPRLMHGKTSLVHHDGCGLYAGVPSPFQATRYHSLVVQASSVPAPPPKGEDGWAVSAWSEDDGEGRVVMGLRRVWGAEGNAPLEGVQFHPESFMTDHGPKLIENFLAM